MWEARVALATFVGNRLYADHGVEVPVYEWEDTTLMRISIGPYNDEPDLERLVDAVRQLASARH